MNLVNIEAEQAVIGACLLGEVLEIDALLPEHFAVDSHREAFAFIATEWAKNHPVDVLALDAGLPEGSPAKNEGLGYWGQCASSSVPSMAMRYAGIVRECAIRREMVAVSSRLAEMAQQHGPVIEHINAASEAIANLASGQVKKSARLIREVLDSHLAVIGDRWDGVVHGADTGFADLDRFMRFRPGNVIVLAARPSMGKTSCAMQFATHLAHQGPVFVSSQEMAEGELADRLLSSQGRISLSSVIGGGMSSDEHDRFHVAVGSLMDLPLYIDDSAGQTLADIRAKARAIHRVRPLKGIVIDYLQLMSGKGENRNSEVEALSRGFKAMAKEFGCPVILLSQLNRGVEQRPNKRPVLSDLRDSGAIEQDADIVLMLYRDEVYNPDSEDKGTAELLIRKNRQGKTGFVRLTWIGEMTMFGNCDYTDARQREQLPQKRRGFDD